MTDRDDTPFWRHVRDMAVPERLAQRMAVFANLGRVVLRPDELFRETSWVSVMLGQGLRPDGYDIAADIVAWNDAQAALRRMRHVIDQGVATMPSHDAFLGGRRPS